jgi:hypothetical protein
VDRLVNPAAYARVGLDPKQAKRVARRNPYHRASMAWLVRQAIATFTAAGLIEGPAKRIWHAAGLLGPSEAEA